MVDMVVAMVPATEVIDMEEAMEEDMATEDQDMRAKITKILSSSNKELNSEIFF